ncbi:major facilitator superfamily domain-containing protein [Usnea florida]
MVSTTAMASKEDLSTKHQTSEGGTTSEKTPSSPPVFPDGGFVAWLQCAGSFFMFFNCWGLVNSFGVFQTFYQQEYITNESSSNISWVGSIQAFLLVFGGVLSGPLYDMGYLRYITIAGSFLVVFGMMMTSIATSYWQLLLSQGIVVGLGYGCLFLPAISVLPSYFMKKRALSQGIASAGSGTAGVLYPIIFHRLQPKIGFGWATRVMAFIMLATLIVPMAGMKMRTKPQVRRKLFVSSAWKEPPFTLFAIASFFGFLGLYIPLFNIQLFAIEQHILSDRQDLAFYLLAILNTGSFFGRIIPTFAADKIGPFNTLTPLTLLATILAFVWIGISTPGGVIVFCLFYGFVSGAFVALSPTCAITLCPSLAVVGVRMGMLFIPVSIGLLIGNPIAGALVENDWLSLQTFCGATLAISTVFLVATRVAKNGPALKVRM